MRRQSLYCGIAGKPVTIALRPGGLFNEPRRAYVWCHERDCQYADANEPPCPLRVDLFADGSERRVAQYLAERARARFCFGCLATALVLRHDQIRRASWHLLRQEGFTVRTKRCAVCRRRHVTVALETAPGLAPPLSAPSRGILKRSAAVAESDEGRRIIDLVVTHGGPFCATCVAFETQLPLMTVQRLLTKPGFGAELSRSHAECHVCTRRLAVIGLAS